MPTYLLDTDTLSDLVRNPQGRVTEGIRREGAAAICTSVVVAAELRYESWLGPVPKSAKKHR